MKHLLVATLVLVASALAALAQPAEAGPCNNALYSVGGVAYVHIFESGHVYVAKESNGVPGAQWSEYQYVHILCVVYGDSQCQYEPQPSSCLL